MVHLTVALYQARRGNHVAARSQMRKAKGRLAAYGVSYHEVALGSLVPAVDRAVEKMIKGEPACLDFGL